MAYYANPFLAQLTYGSIIEHNLFQDNAYGINMLNNSLMINASSYCPYFPECSSVPKDYSGVLNLHITDYTIRYNEFMNNTNKAIYIGTNNDNNTIYGNNFINNNQSPINTLNDVRQFTTQVYESKIQNMSNYWSYDGIGNYWSDYNFQLNNGSIIGKVPMTFPQNGSDPNPVVEAYTQSYGVTETRSNNPDVMNTFVIPLTLTIAVIVTGFILAITVLEYRKYRKNLNSEQTKERNFRRYLLKKVQFRKNKESNELSAETFDMLEEIIEENSNQKD